MTPPALISVYNQSKRVTDADVQRMVAAVGKQLARDVAPVHGMVPAIEFLPAGGKPSVPGGAIAYIIDEPDQPGVLGYHYEDGNGVQTIKVFVNPSLDSGAQVLTGPECVSSVFSHEAIELTGDGPANKWADGPGSVSYALELCDAPQGYLYDIDGVDVSDFLYQAFFDPKAEPGSRLDHMGKITHPFATGAGGYQSTRTAGPYTQVFGSIGASHAEAAPGVHVHFGPDFPEWRKEGQLWKVAQKRGNRAKE